MTDSVAPPVPSAIADPQGFTCLTANIGIKDDSTDFAVVVSGPAAVATGVYTRSRFAGPSVALSREVTATGGARGVLVISKNANVANGARGLSDAQELQRRVADAVGVDAGELVVASTGVIGRPYPMERIRAHTDALSWPPASPMGLDDVAAAIMTTDTHAKVSRARLGGGSIVGIAKGVGMIEPDMATLLTFFFTDADVGALDVESIFRSVMDRTFNALSIDTDTSTSDSAVLLANGAASPVSADEFESALDAVAHELVLMIAADGEGASKVIEVEVTGARDDAQAKRIAKSIVNSPLVKTAVHGADPNWGRVVMAIGKCHDDTDIDPDQVTVTIGGIEMYPAPDDGSALAAAAEHMRGERVHIGADLAIASGGFTVYGCDLTDGYVRINADYTT